MHLSKAGLIFLFTDKLFRVSYLHSSRLSLIHLETVNQKNQAQKPTDLNDAKHRSLIDRGAQISHIGLGTFGMECTAD